MSSCEIFPLFSSVYPAVGNIDFKCVRFDSHAICIVARRCSSMGRVPHRDPEWVEFPYRDPLGTEFKNNDIPYNHKNSVSLCLRGEDRIFFVSLT